MTKDEATKKMRDIMGGFGLPDHVPFAGDVKARAIAAVVQHYSTVGDAAFQQEMADMLACVRVLADGQQQA